MKTVACLEAGQTGVICEKGFENIPLKLLEMGCLPGNAITLVRKAPFSDPICISINGSQYIIRKDTAHMIPVSMDIQDAIAV